MLAQEEKLIKRNKKIFIVSLIGFAVWRVTTILIDLISGPGLLYDLKIPLIVIMLIAMICWVYGFLRMIIPLFKNWKQIKASKALNGEYERFLLLKSFQYSFSILIAVQAILLVVNIFYKIPGGTVIDINILIAVLSFIVVSTILDREK